MKCLLERQINGYTFRVFLDEASEINYEVDGLTSYKVVQFLSSEVRDKDPEEALKTFIEQWAENER